MATKSSHFLPSTTNYQSIKHRLQTAIKNKHVQIFTHGNLHTHTIPETLPQEPALPPPTMYDIIKAGLAALGMVAVFLVVVAVVRGYADRAFIGLAPRVVPAVVAPPAIELATLAPGAPASAAPAAEAAEAAAAAV